MVSLKAFLRTVPTAQAMWEVEAASNRKAVETHLGDVKAGETTSNMRIIFFIGMKVTLCVNLTTTKVELLTLSVLGAITIASFRMVYSVQVTNLWQPLLTILALEAFREKSLRLRTVQVMCIGRGKVLFDIGAVCQTVIALIRKPGFSYLMLRYVSNREEGRSTFTHYIWQISH